MKTQQDFFCNLFRNKWGQTLPWLVIGLGLLLTSCTEKKQPSVILILLDQFKVSDLRCSQEQVTENLLDKGGFEILCEDFVRFTHAYTPSTLEVPSLVSIMTGTYPFEHEVRDNSQFLSRRTLTIPEQLAALNYKTHFISAGLPVLRKSGLQQGFDVFDDAIPTQLSHRSAEDVLRKTLLYFRDLPLTKPVFFTLHLQDLDYPNTQRKSEPLSYEERSMFGVMDSLNDELGRFFSELKRIQRWNDTLIIVAGLRGRSDIERPQKVSALNLHSENTQVALFIKPPTKSRDELQNWKVDHNVTLADLGPTIREYTGLPPEKDRKLVFSLKPSLQNEPVADELEHRTVYIESGYPSWRLKQKPFFAFINTNYLYINNTKKQFYNLRVDSFELNPIALAPTKNDEFHEGWINQAVNRTQALPFNEETAEELFPEALYEDTLLWSHNDNDREVTFRLSKFLNEGENKSFSRYRHWLLYLLLSQRKWSDILTYSNDDYLNFVALVNLDLASADEKKKNISKNLKAQIDSLVKNNPCLQMVYDAYQKKTGSDSSGFDRCNDDKLKNSVQYLFAEHLGTQREMIRKRLENRLKSHLVFRRFALLNESRQLEFDLDISNEHLIEPFEIILYLPTVNRLRIELLNNLITRESRTED